MKTAFSSLVLGALLLVSAPAGAQGVYASYYSGRVVHGYATSRVWIPASCETVERRVWVPGCSERVWVEPVFELRIGPCGERFRVLVAAGYWRTLHHAGHYELRPVRVEVPGHWEARGCRY